MTPAEEFQVLRKTSKTIADLVNKAYAELIKRIVAGEDVKAATDAVNAKFSGEFTKVLIAGLQIVAAEAVGSGTTYMVGEVSLAQSLHANAVKSSAVVKTLVQEHVMGFQNIKTLALEIYEGYGFKEVEVLQLNPTNQTLPKALRALLKDKPTKRALDVGYSKFLAKSLRTPALRAAYLDFVVAIEKAEDGPGQAYLEKKLWVAYQEKLRYYANRIAMTEIHRAYTAEQARLMEQDTALKYVEWRLNPAHPVEDICDFYSGVDRYGLGKGIYPKGLTPVPPAHPHCKCNLIPRLDLNHLKAEEIEGAELAYFASLSPKNQRLIAGSEAKLERVLDGESAWDIHNEKIPTVYQVRTMREYW